MQAAWRSYIDHIVRDTNTRLLHLRILPENIPEIDMEEVSFVLRSIPSHFPHIDHNIIQMTIADAKKIRDHRIASAASNVRVHYLRIDLFFVRRRCAFLQKRADRLDSRERLAVLHHLQHSLRRASVQTHSHRYLIAKTA